MSVPSVHNNRVRWRHIPIVDRIPSFRVVSDNMRYSAGSDMCGGTLRFA